VRRGLCQNRQQQQKNLNGKSFHSSRFHFFAGG
jgi:hypothetical protein